MTPSQFNEYQRQAEVIEQHKKNLEEQKNMTSIEWLLSEIKRRVHIIQSQPMTMEREIMIDNLTVDLEKAKEMHKQEIIDAYNTSFRLRDKPYETAERYYNETFKKD